MTMTQYMISVNHIGPYPDPTTEEAQASLAATGAFNERLMEAGQWVFAGGLQPLDTATAVDGRGGDVTVTDGAFSESKEYLGGFWVIDVADLDEALKIAAEGSKACGQAVVVRPFQGE
jgi:hypothetical protein